LRNKWPIKLVLTFSLTILFVFSAITPIALSNDNSSNMSDKKSRGRCYFLGGLISSLLLRKDGWVQKGHLTEIA
jgi:hypothetical protein